MFLPEGMYAILSFSSASMTRSRRISRLWVRTYKRRNGKDIAATNVAFGYEGLTLPFTFTPATAAKANTGAWDSTQTNPAHQTICDWSIRPYPLGADCSSSTGRLDDVEAAAKPHLHAEAKAAMALISCRNERKKASAPKRK
jgi:hypothetical protein